MLNMSGFFVLRQVSYVINFIETMTSILGQNACWHHFDLANLLSSVHVICMDINIIVICA